MLCISDSIGFLYDTRFSIFYGGLVRRKNVGNTMMACVAIMGISVVMWVLFGYSLAFGGNHAGIIGDFRWFAFSDIGMETGPYSAKKFRIWCLRHFR